VRGGKVGRVCIIADVHANLEALMSVVRDVGEVETWWSLGDAVGYGPYPNECVELLVDLGAVSVAGNHDLGSIGELDLSRFNRDASIANRWTRRVLEPGNVERLAGAPLRRHDVETGALLVHGSPRDPVWEYVQSEERAMRGFESFEEAACFHGHSHVPAVFVADAVGNVDYLDPASTPDVRLEPGSRYLVNAGSVGQPRDGDPRACYLTFYPSRGLVTYHRVAYDVAVTQAGMEAVGLPASLVKRLELGR
jgi:diadenosine tetraphosphatase ApaH/serine/threonine PP2A family protein phosphatase